MSEHATLIDLLDDQRNADRWIRFIDGDRDETTVAYADLWSRAQRLLGVLQARGCEPGDELIIHSKSNERFLIAFWAALLGGLIPVPVAVGDQRRASAQAVPHCP